MIQPLYPWEKKGSIALKSRLSGPLSRYGFLGEETGFPLLGFGHRIVPVYYYYYYHHHHLLYAGYLYLYS